MRAFNMVRRSPVGLIKSEALRLKTINKQLFFFFPQTIVVAGCYSGTDCCVNGVLQQTKAGLKQNFVTYQEGMSLQRFQPTGQGLQIAISTRYSLSRYVIWEKFEVQKIFKDYLFKLIVIQLESFKMPLKNSIL